MKNSYFKILVFVIMGYSQMKAQAPSLTLLNSYSLTPNATDTIGAFARIYYHTPRNKFYMMYAARPAGCPLPAGSLTNFAWREYDINMNFTGNKGTLPGFTSAGDYACVMVDSTYYHLTNLGSTNTGILKLRLTKLDDDFITQATQTITLYSHDNNIDQLLNYTNNRLIIGAMHDSCCSPPTNPPQPFYNPNVHLFQYDLNLNPITADKVLIPKSYSWGASCIFNAGNYYIITMDNANTKKLYSYKYDASFNYISSTLIHPDGQWSQGVLWYGGYYYVAHHAGDHNHGNVLIGIYDNNWNIVNTTSVTTFAVPTVTGVVSYNANRPFLLMQGTKLYVTYDQEKYTFPVNEKTWQSALKVYQINGISGVNELEKNNFFTIYPNPAKDILNISSSNYVGQWRYEVRDVFGKVLLSDSGGSVNISHLANGIYFIQILNSQTGSILSSKRIIKE